MGEIADEGVIYSIVNIINGRTYIGSAVDFLSRKRIHLHQLRNKKHHSIFLQRSFNKYGEDKFIFSILEFVTDKKRLIKREQHYIDLLKPQYNASKVAGSRLGVKQSKETIEKVRISNNGRKHSENAKKAISNALKGNKRQVGNKNKRKITIELISKIEAMRANGMGCRRIAAATGLNKTTILNVFNKKFIYG